MVLPRVNPLWFLTPARECIGSLRGPCLLAACSAHLLRPVIPVYYRRTPDFEKPNGDLSYLTRGERGGDK
jgi:hypothetical protein